MSKFICKICGKEFDRVGNGVYCKGPHYRPCPVCGKPVQFHRLSEPIKCCSSECSRILSERSKSSKLIRCKECGREFHPRQASQIYCDGPHRSVCVICGKEFEYSVRPSEKPKTCSRDCQENLRSATSFSRYGVRNVSQLEDVKNKISEKNSSDKVKSKRRQTSLIKWGVDNPAKNINVRKKMSEVMSSTSYLKRREQTCIDKYGFKSPMMSDDVKSKQANTNLSRYGSTGHPHSKSDICKMMIDGSKVDDYMLFREDPKKFIQSRYDDKPTISKLEADLGVTNTPIYNILIRSNCRDMLQSSFSSMEDSVVDFINISFPDIRMIRCDRTVIKPDEIDIYLPDYKLGIECNPVATHNSSFLDPWGQDPKNRNYHKLKSDKCKDAGVFLFHLFGYEWETKQSIVKSMIRNLVGRNTYRFGGRETYICELDPHDCKIFLASNHRQGNCSASIRLGLKLKSNNELVSVMTFGKLRHTMGKMKSSDNSVWELSRFCNKLNTSVYGGASKLFRHFLNNYKFSEIVSFSDVAHTRGLLYKTLGFYESGYVPPSYTWVDKYDRLYYNRVSCQKSNLKRLLNDPDIDTVNNTEVEIMKDHGFAQVYDSGKIKWSYKPFIN